MAMVEPGHPGGILRGLRAAVGEEHLVQITRRELGDEPGRLPALVVGHERSDGAEPIGLFLDRRDQLRMLVPDVQVHQLGREVEVAPALVVPEPRTLAAGYGQRIDQALSGPRVKDVGAVVTVDGVPRLAVEETSWGVGDGHGSLVGRGTSAVRGG
jgi:hypothetical protein